MSDRGWCCGQPGECWSSQTPCRAREDFEVERRRGAPSVTAAMRQRIAEKAAQYEREMAEERERNRQRGHDLGRSR